MLDRLPQPDTRKRKKEKNQRAALTAKLNENKMKKERRRGEKKKKTKLRRVLSAAHARIRSGEERGADRPRSSDRVRTMFLVVEGQRTETKDEPMCRPASRRYWRSPRVTERSIRERSDIWTRRGGMSLDRRALFCLYASWVYTSRIPVLLFCIVYNRCHARWQLRWHYLSHRHIPAPGKDGQQTDGQHRVRHRIR